jgi:hypothetical protein
MKTNKDNYKFKLIFGAIIICVGLTALFFTTWFLTTYIISPACSVLSFNSTNFIIITFFIMAFFGFGLGFAIRSVFGDNNVDVMVWRMGDIEKGILKAGIEELLRKKYEEKK